MSERLALSQKEQKDKAASAGSTSASASDRAADASDTMSEHASEHASDTSGSGVADDEGPLRPP